MACENRKHRTKLHNKRFREESRNISRSPFHIQTNSETEEIMQNQHVLYAAILQAQQEVYRMLKNNLNSLNMYAARPGQSYNLCLFRTPDGKVWIRDTATYKGRAFFGYSPIRERGWWDAITKRVRGRYSDFVRELPSACSIPADRFGSEWAWVPDHLAPETNQQRTQELLMSCDILGSWQQALTALIMHYDQLVAPMLIGTRGAEDAYTAANEAILFAWQEMSISHLALSEPIEEAEQLLRIVRKCFESCMANQRPARRHASTSRTQRSQAN